MGIREVARDVWPSCISGIFGALAGIFAKMAFDFNPEKCTVDQLLGYGMKFDILEEHSQYLVVFGYALRIIFGILMFLLNGVQLRYLLISMQLNGATKAVIYNFVFNFFFSAISGILIFGETITLKWVIGSTLLLFGVFILTQAKRESLGKEEKAENVKKTQ